MVKIEIHKANGKSSILLDGQPVERGCMGFEISSSGADGFVNVVLKFVTKDLDFVADVHDPISQAPIVQESVSRRKRFLLGLIKR